MHIGIDVGSLTTKIVVIDDQYNVVWSMYARSAGGPIQAIQAGFRQLAGDLPDLKVAGVGATGSGRLLAGIMAGADVVKNEITAHATAAVHAEPDVRTVIDIGGQDSKVIFLHRGVSCGFNMNTVCAAGTGSFLDHQSERLGIPIEQFGQLALRSDHPVRIAGRCGVFAESDLIHKQQMGYCKSDLIAGLCVALARNYVANVLRSRRVQPVVLFQGGVAANDGIRAALESLLHVELVVPPHFQVMGALGAAILASKEMGVDRQTNFRGADRIAGFSCRPRTFLCADCGNLCEISELYTDGVLASRWGSRCGKWEELSRPSDDYDEAAEQRLAAGGHESGIRVT